MKYQYRIKLADTDAAGRIYFASACRIAHESFESFMDSIGYDVNSLISKHPFVFPVVHMTARYAHPLTLGESVVVDTRVKNIGKKSVSFDHKIAGKDGKVAMFVTITHAAVSKRTSKAVDIPPKFRKALLVR